MGIETAIIMGVAGAAVSAVGSIAKGEATQAAATYNAAEDNQQAAEATDKASADEQDYLRKGSDTVETAVADQGAQGVTNSGSPLMVDEDTVRKVALGASRIQQQGAVTASRDRAGAQLATMEGNAAMTASYLDAGSSLLTAGSKFANPNFGKA
jgi:hypothetical protein